MDEQREHGDVVEACDWCGQTVDRDNAHYERHYDEQSESNVVLTFCSEEHGRLFREHNGRGSG
ncbi:hypothetical protein [Salinifilum ghardaiensis]